MHFVEILKCWEECKSSENYDSLPPMINAYIQSSNHHINVTSADDVKSLNSLVAAGFCDEYCDTTQNTILDLIIFFGKNIQTRYQLLTYFSILKPLIYGIISNSVDSNKMKLLKALQLYTEDLHNLNVQIDQILFSRALNFIIRIIHSNDNLLEPALGILANLSHFSSLVKQTLTKKEDFEALRNCLLRIISSDQVSRSALVFSVAVRFHLWNSADKFFEGLNAHRTLQVLFNVLLNGDVSMCGLCAGELLSDLSCAEPQFFTSVLISFPAHKTFLKEVVSQLRAKDSSLLLKLMNLLRILLGNTDSGIDDYIRKLFFTSDQDKKSTLNNDLYQPYDSLLTLFSLVSGSDDLIASVALDLLDELVKIPNQKDPTDLTIPRDFLFVKTVEALRKIGDSSDSLKSTNDCHWDRLSVSGHIFRTQLLIRHLKHLISLFQVDSIPEPTLSVAESDILCQIPVLSNFLCQLVHNHMDSNPLVEILLNDEQENLRLDCCTAVSNKLDADVCLLSCALSAEAMGLLYQCTELLSSCAPVTSQDDEVSLTQNTPDKSKHIETDLKFTQNVARQCGHSLQSLIERPEMPGLLALCLTTSSPFCQSDDVMGMGIQTREDVFRLLNLARHVEKFDSDRFVFLFDLLINPFGINGNKLLTFLSNEELCCHNKLKTPFLYKWFRSVDNGADTFRHVSRSGDIHIHLTESSKTETLEKNVDKYLTNWKLAEGDHVPDDIKLTLSMYEYKIRLLQSREKILEKNATLNAEASASAHKLCDHYRERLELAEYEASKLRRLQIDSITNIHNQKDNFLFKRTIREVGYSFENKIQ
ncbi:unnamed protein product [Heterobilharzia americana]|nr:unnamed protein product [Heterobilharzia americana]